jgi:RNA polymerase sigma-70 factor (ECF subfamily)
MEGALDRLEELCRLASEAQNGRPESLEALLRESAGIVHAVARARFGETLAAEEAAAEALSRAARDLRQLRNVRAYPKWIARIAKRAAADEAKKRRASGGEGVERVDPAAGPEALAEAAERRRAVRATLSLLPRRVRVPVLLHFSEGLSYREIAATLGTSLSTVSRRVAKGLSSLRRALGEEP